MQKLKTEPRRSERSLLNSPFSVQRSAFGFYPGQSSCKTGDETLHEERKDMRNKTLMLMLALSLAVFTFGCRGNNEEKGQSAVATTDTTVTSAAGDTAATTGTVMTGGTISNVADEDKEFVMKAAQGGMAEVTMGNLASAGGTHADVKTFGQRMVTDHSKANDELRTLATTKGLALPSDAGKEHQEMIEKLGKKTGKDFDQEYMKGMVEDHEKDVKEFEKASRDAKDPDIKAWAAKTLPTLQEHLKMAKATYDKVK
jgi:putative membrane protein